MVCMNLIFFSREKRGFRKYKNEDLLGVHDNDNYDIYNSHISHSLIFKLRVPAVNTDTLTYPTNTKKKTSTLPNALDLKKRYWL